MKDWKILLAQPRFRGLFLALLCCNLGSWCVTASLPILVAQRFGIGTELVVSLTARVLPRLLLAPLAGILLRRLGGRQVAAAALVASGTVTALLPEFADLRTLQALIAVTGTLDLFIIPGLLSLRGPVTPPGMAMAGNTLFSVADRLAKIAGPAFGGVAIVFGFMPAFIGFGVLIAGSALPVIRLAVAAPTRAEAASGPGILAGFWHPIRTDRRLLGLLICAVTYMVMMGGLRPFLFWANRDWYHASDAAWTGLLAAQGVGALIGALLSGLGSGYLLRRMSAYALTLWTGLFEGVLHLGLLVTTSATQAMLVLALAGIPELISTATWFTVLQQRLPAARQGAFLALCAPLWDAGFVLGALSAGLHAQGVLSLSGYWAVISLTATLPIVPLLLVAGRSAAVLVPSDSA